MKKIVFLLLLMTFQLSAQSVKLSPEATVSVITCGPWQKELYSAFGHSAIRVHDPINGIDEAYNYGVFDFDQPNFYLNFARGYLYYKLGVYDYQRFQNYYIYYNRYVHQQVLNLSEEQKQKVYDYLQWNSLPENEHYRYDYFYNNCATKMRDVIEKALKDDVKFDGSYIKTDYSIRDLTDIYLVHQPWGDLGIDIGLGLPIDKKAAPHEYMFLPDYVESGFDHATIAKEGKTESLVKNKIIVYESRPEEIEKGPPHPAIVFSIFALIAIGLSIYDYKRDKLSIWFDTIFFAALGLVGLLLFFLWFATDHHASARNFNLLWALPTHFVAFIAFLRQPKWLKNYFFGVLVLSGLLLLTWFILPQQLNSALIPIVVAMIARSYIQFKIRSRRN